MAILEVRKFPDPILRQRAVKVTRFDAKLAKLAADMVETMEAERGVGLAANQVGVLQRLCVVKPEDWEEPLVLVNPEIIRREGQREVEEGCLSLPGYRGMVNRSVRIRVRYQDLAGKQLRLKADCVLAQAIEHETDHLNGILYIDHLVAHDQFFRIHVTEEGDVEYIPTGEPDAAELENAARRMNHAPPVPQFDPTSGRPVSPRNEDATAATDMDADRLLTRLGGFFAARGVDDVWVVGGAVRDAIRGREVHDIDLVVAGDAQPAGRAVADFLGGTPVPVEPWNITRVALPAAAEGAAPFLIDIAGCHGSLEENLRSRDFTVDAMAVPLRCWDTEERFDTIVDPLNGKADLVRGVLRATGDDVFQDDPGRMLRGVRLANRLGFRMEPDTARAIRRDAPLLHRVSAERVRDEFMDILAADGARVQLEVLDRLDLLCRVLPELEAARNCEQPRAHHYWDVWGHLLHCVEYAEAVTAGHRNNAIYTMAPWTAAEDAYFGEIIGDGHTRRTVLKLAALLHDIAKPQTKAPDENGRIRFLGHSEQGAEMVETRLPALRLSRRTTSLVSAMVLHHLRPSQLREKDKMPSRRAIYRYYRDVGDAAVDTLYLAMADFLAARGPELSPERWNNYARMIAAVLEAGAAPPSPAEGPRALVNGHDLMDTLNIHPGPRIGALLERLREAEAVGEIANRDDALSLAARLLADNEFEV